MEEKINIAEILKNKPEGTKLYNLLYNIDVELETIVTTGTKTIVWCTDKIDNNDVCHRFYSEFGTIEGYPDGLQILLPSKEMRDWSKFAWKKGDVLVNSLGFKLFFDRWANYDYTRFFGKVNLLEDSFSYETEKYTLASKEETLDTLEIEKPEFKDGDIAFVESHMLGINTSLMIAIFRKEKEIDKYKFSPALCESNVHDTYLREYPVVLSPSDIKTLRPATDSEKQQLFDALEKEGKAWDAEKKKIVILKPKWTPKPFDRVITRTPDTPWTANFFSHIDSDGVKNCIDDRYLMCLPYNEQTAKLIGTTNNVEG